MRRNAMKFVTNIAGLMAAVYLWLPLSAHADEALIAVAANFDETVAELKTEFEARSQHRITVTTGSTGSLYAQIVNGAPYDLFLAADQARPLLLEKSGDGVDGSRFTFATGRLALWSADSALIQADLQTTLAQTEIVALAIPNPALAPYGIASRETLQSLQMWETLRRKIVMGENAGQTHALIATGNAQAGFVALSMVIAHAGNPASSYLPVPEELHAPIRQDAVLLRHGRSNSAAMDFLTYLRSDEGRAVIKASGYGVD